MKFDRIILVSLLSSSMLIAPVIQAAELALPSGDLVAPVIKHEPISQEVEAGQVVDVTATVTDNVGVKEVILFYRESNDGEFRRIKMTRDLDSNNYAAKLPVSSPGLEYYIQATDLAGNTLLFGHSFSPLTVNVASKPAPKAAPPVVASEESEGGVSKWVWVGLGVVAVGALSAGGGGGGGGGPTGPTGTGSGTIVIDGAAP